MATASAGQWVKFFNTAGIPSQSAATYAHIFVENRIQTDMLMDLNKEYLREMGVTIMGDIIAILRHAKHVSEQNAREKVLSSEVKVPVAAVPANTASVTTKKSLSSKASIVSSEVVDASRPDYEESATIAAAKPQPRRVLPEHEGRYKITLPSGTTQRSKEILAKKALLYADKEQAKPGVFERLSMSSNSDGSRTGESEVRLIKIDKQHASTSSSIFSRLGGRDEFVTKTITKKITPVSGILKNSPTKKVTGVVKKTIKPQQKVILVKKIPAKAATMIADDYDPPERMETGEKSVSFSSEDEIVEIASRRVIMKPRTNKRFVGIKARLGENAPQNLAVLHKTRKIVKLKPTIVKKSSPIKHPEAAVRMKSDELLMRKPTPVHNRLGAPSSSALKSKSSSSMSQLTNRIGRVSLSKRPQQSSAAAAAATSVFDRLGYNNANKY
ncbi:unnamed protein product [Hermetia illucens]|uniref:SAM domain-containing protein n=1 Tax=Hermetia illucens TaxID=343691 RepID=A0A7R8YUR7_HERIL|nr:uncharacterized protein C19orf47 isoform X2 [Hermetia illucens]CAD7086087.1 unnamed protein product [Hermetia illucens]